MGVKISSLPVNALPYTGAEKIALVQGGETRAGTLSSLTTYYAVKSGGNNFTGTQNINGPLYATNITANEFILNNSVRLSAPIDNSDSVVVINSFADSELISGSSFSIVIGKGTVNTKELSKVVAIGHECLKNSTTPYLLEDTVAIGHQAGIQLNGTANTFIGREAGTNSACSQSIGIGRFAGSSAGGNNNIFIGENSGKYITGSNNITIGSDIQISPTNAQGCIVLGHGASATANNQFVLGSTTVPLSTTATTGTISNYLIVNINGSLKKIALYNL